MQIDQNHERHTEIAVRFRPKASFSLAKGPEDALRP